MPIKILCLGDIVGKPGRLAVQELLPKVIQERGVDFVVANAENAAGGSGLTPPIFEKILRAGVDVCTLGDHTFRKREVLPLLEKSERLIRPVNFPPAATGGPTMASGSVISEDSALTAAALESTGNAALGHTVDILIERAGPHSVWGRQVVSKGASC